MFKKSFLKSALAIAILTFSFAGISLAATVETTTSEVPEDAVLELTGELEGGQANLTWTVGSPENLTSGFKVLKSKVNAEPIYGEEGTDYHYFDDNDMRADSYKDLMGGETYFFRVCQYNGGGDCVHYSNTVELTVAEDVVTVVKEEQSKEESTATVEDAELELSGQFTSEGAKLTWEVAKPDNLKQGFKVVKSYEVEAPVYPGNDYKYYSNNDQRTHIFKDLKAGKTYYFRVCQYNGECPFYSNVISLNVPEDYEYAKEILQKKEYEKAADYFKDVKAHWGKEYAEKLHTHCGIDGFKDSDDKPLYEFRPNAPITRAELVKMLSMCMGGEKDSSEEKFSDIPKDAWYRKAVMTAYMKGWIDGYEDGTFRPLQYVNRAEALKMILLTKHATVADGESTLSDIRESDWFHKYVSFAVKKGIVSGYKDGTFKPGNMITRAEAAKIIVKVKGL